MPNTRLSSSSKSGQYAPAENTFRSSARSSSRGSRSVDSFDPPSTRSSSKTSQSLSRSSRLSRHNSAPARSTALVKGDVQAATTQDDWLVPADAPVRRKSARLRSRHDSAPVRLQPPLQPVPGSPSGPSAQAHADNCSGPVQHVDGVGFGPQDGHEAPGPIGGRQLDFASEKDADGNDSADNGGTSTAGHENYHQLPIGEADHEQESFNSPNSGQGNERADALMKDDERNLSSHSLREEGMQESGPCNPTGRASVSHGSVPDSDPGLSGHLASPADSSIVYHHAGSFSPDSLPIPPPPQAPPPAASPSEILDAKLRDRGLQMVETGGRGNCFFTSVIASVQHAAFLPAGSQLLQLLSTERRCSALRVKIYQTFMSSPDDARFRTDLDDSAWQRYARGIRDQENGDERCIAAIADIFGCNVHVYSPFFQDPEIYMPASGLTVCSISIGQFGDGSRHGHFVSVQHRDAMQDVPVDDNRPCIVCHSADEHEHTLLCQYCDSPCHF